MQFKEDTWLISQTILFNIYLTIYTLKSRLFIVFAANLTGQYKQLFIS